MIGRPGNHLLPLSAQSTVAPGQKKAAKLGVGSPASIPDNAYFLTCGEAQPCPTAGKRSRACC